MNVDSDVAFFYEIYAGLHRLMEHDATCFDEQLILSLLLYTENTIAVGLDGVYEYRYRCVGNVVFNGATVWTWTQRPHRKWTTLFHKPWQTLLAAH